MKKRRLKKKPLIILLIIVVIFVFLIVKLNKKEEVIVEKPQEDNKPPVVEKKSPLDMSVDEFTLEGYFEGTVLTENKVDDDFMSTIVYAGDSVALYYTINEVNKKAVYHQISINPKTAQTCKVYLNSVKEYESYVEIFTELKPSIVIMTLGTNGVATMNKDYFVEQYEQFLKSIMKASPDTKLIVQSIPPVPIERDIEELSLNNKKINDFNYYLAEMCEKLNLKFLFSANSMKDEKGGCREGYCTKDLHPTKDGNKELYDYAKNHLGSYS